MNADAQALLAAIFPDPAKAWLVRGHHSTDTKMKVEAGGYGIGLKDEDDAFYCVAELRPGATSRSTGNASLVRVLVLDDVGVKIAPGGGMEMFCPLEPSFVVETSPGSCQWGFIIDGGMPVEEYRALREAMEGHPIWGASDGADPVHIFRLPMGTNTKPKHGGFKPRLLSRGQSKGFSPADIRTLAGGAIIRAPRAPAAGGEKMILDEESLRALLTLVPNPAGDNRAYWIAVGHYVFGAFGSAGFDAFDEWSAPHASYDQAKTWRFWDTIVPSDVRSRGGKLRELAENADPAGFEAWRRKYDAARVFDDGAPAPGPEDVAAVDAGAEAVTLSAAAPEPTAGIRRRPWLYGRRLLRGYLSSTIAAGGTGKSSLTTVEAVAMATGRDLLGVGTDNMPRAPLKVLLWNGEDPQHELQLRFNAVCSHYGLVGADFSGGMFMVSGRDRPLRLGSERHHKGDLAWLRGAIAGNGVDVVVIDPFVASHAVPENDNVAIAGIAKTWSDLADEMGCAVDLVHHIRKPSNGAGVDLTVDDARGASALVNASRNARVLSPMGDKVAKDTGTVNRKAFFAIQHDATKANMVPGAVGASWFKFVSVDMGNGDPFPADGGRAIPADSVGVVEACTLSPSIAAIPANIVAAQQAMAGKDWRAHPTAKDWVGIPVGGALGLDPTDKIDRRVVESAIQSWLKDGWLVAVEKLDQHRMMKGFIEVGRAPEDIEF